MAFRGGTGCGPVVAVTDPPPRVAAGSGRLCDVMVLAAVVWDGSRRRVVTVTLPSVTLRSALVGPFRSVLSSISFCLVHLAVRKMRQYVRSARPTPCYFVSLLICLLFYP